MNGDRATHAYAGICRACNGTMMLAVDEIEHASNVASIVAECIAFGYIIERMTIEDARARAQQWCKCEKAEGCNQKHGL